VKHKVEVEEFHLEKGIEERRPGDEEEERAWNRNSILGH
jgi:hypothetical protein